MSKLYEQYLKLKNENSSTIYLFRSGLFYIVLEDDALKLSEQLKLKLTNFRNVTLKCGFPESRLKYYLEKFKELNLDYILVESETPKSNTSKTRYMDLEKQNNSINANLPELNINQIITELIYEIANLDINNITLKNSFDELYKFHIKAKKIIKDKN